MPFPFRPLAAALAAAALLPAAAVAAPPGVTEFSAGLSAGARPDAITAGPDGNLWFSERGAARIGRITPAGEITEFTTGLDPAAQVNALTAGPDGNVWFTEENRTVGRITPAGEITEFPAPPGGLPRGITSGPGGQLWVALGPGGQIGHIGTDGSGAASFGGLTTGASADDLVAGPDGNLWVVEFSGSRIARATPDGQVTEFPVGALSGPRSITVGPDGALWFTVEKGNAVGRVTTDGQLQQFNGGLAGGAGPVDITTGGDGNLWATVTTKYMGSRIARVTPAGEITELLLDDGVDAAGITTAADGDVWFTEPSVGRIARLSLAQAAPAPQTVHQRGDDGLSAPSAGPAKQPATAPKTCRVPRLTGLTPRSALARLKAAHCATGKVVRAKRAPRSGGRVRTQRPKAGATVRRTVRVTLTVR